LRINHQIPKKILNQSDRMNVHQCHLINTYTHRHIIYICNLNTIYICCCWNGNKNNNTIIIMNDRLITIPINATNTSKKQTMNSTNNHTHTQRTHTHTKHNRAKREKDQTVKCHFHQNSIFCVITYPNKLIMPNTSTIIPVNAQPNKTRKMPLYICVCMCVIIYINVCVCVCVCACVCVCDKENTKTHIYVCMM